MMIYNSGIGKNGIMTFPLPVKVAYCLFCLCVHLFPGGEEGALFYYDIY